MATTTNQTMNQATPKPAKIKKNNGVRLEKTELIFKIFAYVLCGIFAVMCLYPFIYAISAAVSSRNAFYSGQVVLLPMIEKFAEDGSSLGYSLGVDLTALKEVLLEPKFWLSYSNTLFVTFYGTIWSLGVSIFGGYALSKKRLCFRTGFNFYLLFTMWFTAGLVPQYLNYMNTQEVFDMLGITDKRWMIVIAMGMNAFNVILLRNAFESVPKEIEEAAIVDGASEFSLLWSVYVPMSKSAIATVGLFYGISRWNGYFWAKQVLTDIEDQNAIPLQVFIKQELQERIEKGSGTNELPYAAESFMYSMIICAIIPIIIIYPYLQKYFATGVNVGGVKE